LLGMLVGVTILWALLAAGRLVIVLTVALYFAPTLVAQGRGHLQAGEIFTLNLFLGWTLLGWVVALVWALYVDVGEPSHPRPSA
jgi:hypothetical protein